MAVSHPYLSSGYIWHIFSLVIFWNPTQRTHSGIARREKHISAHAEPKHKQNKTSKIPATLKTFGKSQKYTNIDERLRQGIYKLESWEVKSNVNLRVFHYFVWDWQIFVTFMIYIECRSSSMTNLESSGIENCYTNNDILKFYDRYYILYISGIFVVQDCLSYILWITNFQSNM